jgi:predicted O-methyltransferase YrrM
MEFFTRAKDAFMAVSRQTADLLYILARSRGARSIVEFGTSFGISTLCLAAAGLDDVTEIRAGDAREILATGLPDPVDLLFLDGAKEMYVDVLHIIEPHFAGGQPGCCR